MLGSASMFFVLVEDGRGRLTAEDLQAARNLTIVIEILIRPRRMENRV